MSDHPATDANASVNVLAAEYWELLLERNPTWATDIGDRRFDDRLPQLDLECRAQYFQQLRDLSARLARSDIGNLTGQAAITHDVLSTVVSIEIAGEDFIEEQYSINPLHGPVTWLTEFPERQPILTREEFDRLKRRFEQVPHLFHELQQHLKIGIANGTTAPWIGPERLSRQIHRMLEAAPEHSAFMPQSKPDAMSEETFNSRKQELSEVVARQIYPVLVDFATFLDRDYGPKSRRVPGLVGMPGGSDYYQHLIEHYTGSTESSEVIHQIGREELDRLHEEMEAIALDTYGIRDIRETANRLRARDDQYLPDREALLRHNRVLLERANAALPGYFSLLPKRICEVRAIESYREIDSPAGYYSHAPDDGYRPAYYYVNTYKPEQRPLYNMEALAFHEAVPGHHLQIAIAQDLQGIPDFRRHTGQTAYIEGWALYSERLSDEMGLYSSPLTRFGMLNYQAWRAARLVLDTGIHALGWTRDQAIQTILESTAHTESEAIVEVDRYICMPAQALSYMLGRITFDSLRARVKSRLSDQFDIRDFHSRVLENGAVPLRSLSHIIDRWLDTTTA